MRLKSKNTSRLPWVKRENDSFPANIDSSRDSGKSEGSNNQKGPLSDMRVWKKSSGTRVHSSTERILCGGIGCKAEFSPIRKDQVFCSPNCKLKYFNLARKLGIALVKGHAVELNPLGSEPGGYEVKCNGQIIRFYLGKEKEII